MSDIEPPDITARELLTRADGIIQWACDTNAGDAWRAAAKTWTDLNARFAPVLDAYEEGFSAGAESVGTVAGESEIDFADIRIAALDSAVRFLADTAASAGDILDLAQAFEAWVRTGVHPGRPAEPAPPLEGGGTDTETTGEAR